MEFNGFVQKLGYYFTDEALISEAFRHSSYVNEQGDSDLRDNEWLEFLGDAVLNLVVGHLLMQRYPEMKEGDLSRMRANLVNESQLAEIARTIDLGSHIMLGKGEVLSNGREKNSILADTFEAVVAPFSWTVVSTPYIGSSKSTWPLYSKKSTPSTPARTSRANCRNC